MGLGHVAHDVPLRGTAPGDNMVLVIEATSSWLPTTVVNGFATETNKISTRRRPGRVSATLESRAFQSRFIQLDRLALVSKFTHPLQRKTGHINIKSDEEDG